MSSLKKPHFCGPFCPQDWSFPNPFILYITENPSTTKLYHKLRKTCKFFYSKNPIIVTSGVSYSNKFKKWLAVNTYNGRKQSYFVNSPKILWITDSLEVSLEYQSLNLQAIIFPKFYRIEIIDLRLILHSLTFTEFTYISPKVVTAVLDEITVIDNNGSSNVPLEKLIKVLSKIKVIQVYNRQNHSTISSATVSELLKLSHFSDIHYFVLNKIPETFDVETLFIHIKQNKNTRFELEFSAISEAFKNRIQVIKDEIERAPQIKYHIPYFSFSMFND